MAQSSFKFVEIFLILCLLSILSLVTKAIQNPGHTNIYNEQLSCQQQPKENGSAFDQSMQFIKHLWNHGSAASSATKWTESMGKLTKFKFNDIEGKVYDFSQLNGKAVIITNIACECGFTKGGLGHLTKWKTELKDEPFEVIAFSSNSFNQEKKSGQEVKDYIDEHFGLNFPVMETSDVNGDNTNEVYRWLKQSFEGDITWNFSTYFVIDHRGVPVHRFEKESWDQIRSTILTEVEAAKEAAKANQQ